MRGKPHERSKIINKLKGHIVQLSQHKFASNVVEKCLEYGDVNERGLLIEEIIGHNGGNDHLLVSQIQRVDLNIGIIVVENASSQPKNKKRNSIDQILSFSMSRLILCYFICFAFSHDTLVHFFSYPVFH